MMKTSIFQRAGRDFLRHINQQLPLKSEVTAVMGSNKKELAGFVNLATQLDRCHFESKLWQNNLKGLHLNGFSRLRGEGPIGSLQGERNRSFCQGSALKQEAAVGLKTKVAAAWMP